MEDESNAELYTHFRGTYCSRICFVVDVNNKVVSKFNIIDWQKELPNHLDS